MRPYFSKIARAYLIGSAAQDFSKTLDGDVAIVQSGTLQKAVAQAAQDAANDKRDNAVVLLSPACASFDQYKNFEIRGDAFVAAVAALPNVAMTLGG